MNYVLLQNKTNKIRNNQIKEIVNTVSLERMIEKWTIKIEMKLLHKWNNEEHN